MNKKFTNIELFAGGGGLALGLEEAGFEGLAFVECNKWACQTLRLNRPKWNVVEQDIYSVSFEKYKDQIDLVSGGAPCQAFSHSGKKLGFEDKRGTLFREFARCVKEVQPKIFLFENVKGLLNHNNGQTIMTIEQEFQNLGYQLKKKVLNASYFGVGQKRERLLMIGIRNDLVHKSEFKFPIPEKKQTTLKKALLNCPKSDGQSYSSSKKKIMDMVPSGGCWIHLPEETAKEYMGKSYYSGGGRRGIARRMSWEKPCLTLTTSPSQKQTERCHPDESRPFTVREYARIQSFPDKWEFCGSVTERYKQIGNAVPVELSRRIGVEIINFLEKI